VIVVDTSAWIELFRGRSHPVTAALEGLIERRADIAITEVVLMEALAGAPSVEALTRIRAQLVGLPILRLEGLADFEEAALLYRVCRSAGHTLRNQVDCLIAVPAIHHGASILHNDRDFDTIAQHSALKLETVPR
jgi:predicted nucleic acid-binding protein